MATIYKGPSVEAPRSSAKATGMVCVSQQVTVSTALALADVVRFGPFPAGFKPSHVKFVHGDLDTDGSPTLAVKVGYTPVDGSTGDDDLFGAAVTAFNAASAAGGTDLAATTVTEIQKDWYLDIVVTTAAEAMAAAKTIFAVVFGEGVGAK